MSTEKRGGVESLSALLKNLSDMGNSRFQEANKRRKKSLKGLIKVLQSPTLQPSERQELVLMALRDEVNQSTRT